MENGLNLWHGDVMVFVNDNVGGVLFRSWVLKEETTGVANGVLFIGGAREKASSIVTIVDESHSMGVVAHRNGDRCF